MTKASNINKIWQVVLQTFTEICAISGCEAEGRILVFLAHSMHKAYSNIFYHEGITLKNTWILTNKFSLHIKICTSVVREVERFLK